MSSQRCLVFEMVGAIAGGKVTRSTEHGRYAGKPFRVSPEFYIVFPVNMVNWMSYKKHSVPEEGITRMMIEKKISFLSTRYSWAQVKLFFTNMCKESLPTMR